MTVASGKIDLQSKHNLIRHVAKVKATTSAHSMVTFKYLFSIFIIPFKSNAITKRKEIFHRIKKTISVALGCPCINVLTAFSEQTSQVP